MEREPHAQLRDLLCELSVRIGRFTLASGRESNFYVDVKQTALHPDGASLLGQLLLERVRSIDDSVGAIAGVAVGGVPLCTAASLSSVNSEAPLPALIVRKAPKQHGTSAAVEGMHNVSSGARVVLIEDTVTSGGSSIRALDAIRSAGLEPVAILAVVDRQEGAAEAITAAGTRFESLFTRAELEG